MDTYRAFLAVIISFVILLGYQYFFVGFDTQEPPAKTSVESTAPAQTGQQAAPAGQQPSAAAAPSAAPPVAANPAARDIKVETALYTAVFSENGGVLKSLRAKEHKETNEEGSPDMDLVNSDDATGYPLNFSWGSAVPQGLYFQSGQQEVAMKDGKGTLTMTADAGNGLQVVRTYSFDDSTYLMGLDVTVKNSSGQPLQGIPQLYQVNTPFSKTGSPADRFLFRGPES